MSQEKPNVESLSHLRAEIDRIDAQLIELLNRRADIVVRVGKTKQQTGTSIYAPDREHEVLERIRQLNAGPLPDKTVTAIWRELMSGSFALEKPLRVAFLGPEGSFSHLAAMRKFGASVEYLPMADIRAVFTEVRGGHVDLGMVPIENSVGGGVIDTLDAFLDANVRVVAEVLVEVHHNLLAKYPQDEISMIASKPEVFAQCRNWLSGQFHKVDLVPTASTAKAAEMAAKQHGLAAIGSILASELYGLNVIFAGIEDNPANVTRFFVIGTEPTPPTGSDKTALMFVTGHKPGALVEVLEVLRKHKVNMTNIATRPSKRGDWEYTFFVDCEGHCETGSLPQAIADARQHCLQFNVLGSFPKAREAI
ncbi:MAG: prephenate dehydratase [Planctomycetes bacterium]|nr:prephenate dehydratase [Planctomycetota bacterium]